MKRFHHDGGGGVWVRYTAGEWTHLLTCHEDAAAWGGILTDLLNGAMETPLPEGFHDECIEFGCADDDAESSETLAPFTPQSSIFPTHS